ncbi:MAG: two-component system, chemotaxis family, chemotaxis protein CheY [Solirubrobacteraceae bacterium]|jgi:two-component system chemotaxis response regulator CheY|nr:two-component system, chemotaxis family, chemotaxis protein CheY [Solirubrobacteraceae bacterium]
MSRAVLVVDDDRFLRKLVATTLEDVSAFNLHEAADGLEALELARDTEPAIVFLDVDMPGLDGIDTCRRLRSDPATRATTIVMLTASQGAHTERLAHEAGADLFLTKPFSPLDLLRLVDRLAGLGDSGTRGLGGPTGRETGQSPAPIRAGGSGDLDEDDRVDHEQNRERDRPAV